MRFIAHNSDRFWLGFRKRFPSVRPYRHETPRDKYDFVLNMIKRRNQSSKALRSGMPDEKMVGTITYYKRFWVTYEPWRIGRAR